MPNFDIHGSTNLCYYICNKFLTIITLKGCRGPKDLKNILKKVCRDRSCFLIFHQDCDKKFREHTDTRKQPRKILILFSKITKVD